MRYMHGIGGVCSKSTIISVAITFEKLFCFFALVSSLEFEYRCYLYWELVLLIENWGLRTSIRLLVIDQVWGTPFAKCNVHSFPNFFVVNQRIFLFFLLLEF